MIVLVLIVHRWDVYYIVDAIIEEAQLSWIVMTLTVMHIKGIPMWGKSRARLMMFASLVARSMTRFETPQYMFCIPRTFRQFFGVCIRYHTHEWLL